MDFWGSVLLALSIAFAGWQFHKENKRKRIEKAIELSKFFADEIIPACSQIIRKYDELNLTTEIENAINLEKVKYFDEQELSQMNPDMAEKWKNAYNPFMGDEREKNVTLLNHLEYFSMQFTSKVADEKAVYQSLHQAFLKTIKLMYVYIAMMNKNNNSKYYTNIIELFTSWEKRRVKHTEKEKKSRVKKGSHKQPRI